MKSLLAELNMRYFNSANGYKTLENGYYYIEFLPKIKIEK